MSDRRLWAVDPGLAEAYRQIKPEFEQQFPGCTLTVGQGFRTPAMQVSAKSHGRSPFDGTTSFSKHQAFPALALDALILDEGGQMLEDGTDPRYRWLGERFEQLGFVWGGRFVHPRPDWDHFEVSGPKPTRADAEVGLSAYQAAVEADPTLTA